MNVTRSLVKMTELAITQLEVLFALVLPVSTAKLAATVRTSTFTIAGLDTQ